jgi:hypothetical protein
MRYAQVIAIFRLHFTAATRHGLEGLRGGTDALDHRISARSR